MKISIRCSLTHEKLHRERFRRDDSQVDKYLCKAFLTSIGGSSLPSSAILKAVITYWRLKAWDFSMKLIKQSPPIPLGRRSVFLMPKENVLKTFFLAEQLPKAALLTSWSTSWVLISRRLLSMLSTLLFLASPRSQICSNMLYHYSHKSSTSPTEKPKWPDSFFK